MASDPKELAARLRRHEVIKRHPKGALCVAVHPDCAQAADMLEALAAERDALKAECRAQPGEEEGKPALGDHSYAEQWAQDTLSGPIEGRFPWGERNLAKAYLSLKSERDAAWNAGAEAMREACLRETDPSNELGCGCEFCQTRKELLEDVSGNIRALPIPSRDGGDV